MPRRPSKSTSNCAASCRERPRADSIEEAIDYVRVRDEAERVTSKRPYALIEAIAERIATRLLEVFETDEVRVRVRKPSALAGFGVPWAGVEVVRARHG